MGFCVESTRGQIFTTRNTIVHSRAFSVLSVASGGGSHVGAGGIAQSSESSESSVLGLVVLVGQTLDGLGGVVNLRAHLKNGSVGLGLRGGLSLLDTVGELVLHVEDEHTSVTFALLILLLSAGDAQVGVAGAGDLRFVVQVVQRVRIVGELLSVELNKVAVVFFGESPKQIG